jgi:hypothetical protein
MRKQIYNVEETQQLKKSGIIDLIKILYTSKSIIMCI